MLLLVDLGQAFTDGLDTRDNDDNWSRTSIGQALKWSKLLIGLVLGLTQLGNHSFRGPLDEMVSKHELTWVVSKEWGLLCLLGQVLENIIRNTLINQNTQIRCMYLLLCLDPY